MFIDIHREYKNQKLPQYTCSPYFLWLMSDCIKNIRLPIWHKYIEKNRHVVYTWKISDIALCTRKSASIYVIIEKNKCNNTYSASKVSLVPIPSRNPICYSFISCLHFIWILLCRTFKNNFSTWLIRPIKRNSSYILVPGF